MTNAGISRIIITDSIGGAGAWRFEKARQRHASAVELYRRLFAALAMPLAPGDAEVRCTKQEFVAGYDYQLGIDVILTFANSGRAATLQEKFLFTGYNTVTVEYMQNHATQEPGDWFNIKAQYYFVGYDYDEDLRFERWVLLNWSALMDATERDQVPWKTKPNTHDNARASFRYVDFRFLPATCIVAAHYGDVWIPPKLKSNWQS